MASLVEYEQFKEDLRSVLLEGYSVKDDFSELFDYISSLENPRSVLEHVRVFKEEGNWLFKNGDLDGALENYGLAGVYLTTAILEDKNDLIPFNDLACCVCLNMAACLLKKKEFMQVGQLCSIVLTHNPDNVKAHYRRALAAMELNRFDLAFWDLKLALEIEPSNREVEKTFSKVKALFHSPSKNHVQEPIGLGVGFGLPKKASFKKQNGEQLNMYKKESCPNDVHMEVSGLDEMEVPDTNLEKPSMLMLPMEEDNSSIVDMSNDSSTEVLESKAEEEGESRYKEEMNINMRSMETEQVNVAGKDTSNQTETSLNYENGCKMSTRLTHSKKVSPKYKDQGSISSSATKQRDLAEPKYRFYNRGRRGSTFMISKNDYLLLSQGKTLSFYNSRTCSYLQVKAPGIKNTNEVSSSSCVSCSNGGNEDEGSSQSVVSLTSLDKESGITSVSSTPTSASVLEEVKEGLSFTCEGNAVLGECSGDNQFCFSSVRKKELKRKQSMVLQAKHKQSKSNCQVYGSKTRYLRPSNGTVACSTNISSCRLKHGSKRKCIGWHNFNRCINQMESPPKKMKASLCSSSHMCSNVGLYDNFLGCNEDCMKVIYSLDGGT